MTMLTHSFNWETVRTDVWVKRGKANRPSLSLAWCCFLPSVGRTAYVCLI